MASSPARTLASYAVGRSWEARACRASSAALPRRTRRARRVGGVDAHPLAGQQVVVDRLGEQRMAEDISAPARGRLEHMRVDRLTQRGVQDRARQIHDARQLGVADPTSGDRGHPGDFAGLRRTEPVQAHQHQVGEVPRQLPGVAHLPACGHEFLGEEGVAVGAADDVADVCFIELGAREGVFVLGTAEMPGTRACRSAPATGGAVARVGQVVHQAADRIGRERIEVHSLHGGQPEPLGQRGAERVPAV